MTKQIILYSPIALEQWDFRTPNTTGIGGSETCHVELAFEFAKAGLNVISIAPCEREELGPGNVRWLPKGQVDVILSGYTEEALAPIQTWLVFRDPTFFDKELPKKNKYYFVAQDVDYDWNEERLAKVDKYICLCKTHAQYTLSRYPSLKGRVFISTNGINSTLLRAKYKNNTEIRNPKRIIYSSSPDRGLECILENWFRVEERHPDAKLEVYYGFDNLLKIAKGNQNHFLYNLYHKILNLASKYPKSVTLNGRIPQNQLYTEMLRSSIWFYPSDWPETSCITCMEMQAMGVYPILNNYWAQGENVLNGTKIEGIPQKNQLCKAILFKELNNMLENPISDSMRDTISEDALDSFGWDKVAKQYVEWFKND